MSRFSPLTCALLACASLLGSACLQVSTGTDSSGTGGTSGSDAGTTSSGDSSTGSTGVNCGADPETGVTLCLGTSACPNMSIDTSAFPNCGFRPGGSGFDVECICNGAELCPVGVPTSCDEVTQLLTQQQSALQVCQQVATGGCLGIDAGSGAGSSSGGSTTGLSTECQTCVSGCGGTPACYQSCGC